MFVAIVCRGICDSNRNIKIHSNLNVEYRMNDILIREFEDQYLVNLAKPCYRPSSTNTPKNQGILN